jgi:hypothetical protein
MMNTFALRTAKKNIEKSTATTTTTRKKRPSPKFSPLLRRNSETDMSKYTLEHFTFDKSCILYPALCDLRGLLNVLTPWYFAKMYENIIRPSSTVYPIPLEPIFHKHPDEGNKTIVINPRVLEAIERNEENIRRVQTIRPDRMHSEIPQMAYLSIKIDLAVECHSTTLLIIQDGSGRPMRGRIMTIGLGLGGNIPGGISASTGLDRGVYIHSPDVNPFRLSEYPELDNPYSIMSSKENFVIKSVSLLTREFVDNILGTFSPEHIRGIKEHVRIIANPPLEFHTSTIKTNQRYDLTGTYGYNCSRYVERLSSNPRTGHKHVESNAFPGFLSNPTMLHSKHYNKKALSDFVSAVLRGRYSTASKFLFKVEESMRLNAFGKKKRRTKNNKYK